MDSYRREESAVSYAGSVPLNPNQNGVNGLEYNDALYMIPNSQCNTIWSEGTTQSILYSDRNAFQDFPNNNMFRRNLSVPILVPRNLRRNESSCSTERLSANRYPMPQRQLSVPSMSNVNLTERQSEISRIHQELARYHNSLQQRLRNSPRFTYQPGPGDNHNASQDNPNQPVPIAVNNYIRPNNFNPNGNQPNSPTVNYNQPNMSINSGRTRSNNSMNMNLNTVRRNNSNSTRNFSRNNSNFVSINTNPMVYGPTQSMSLVEPIEIGLPPQVIESFPVNLFNNTSSELDENLRSCSVCLEEYSETDRIRRLPCTHGFHVNCIDTWLRKNTRCPICKFDYIVMLQL